MVEMVQRIGFPPARALDGTLARETLTLSVGGERVEVEVERVALPRTGAQAFWCCPQCSALRAHLYVLGGALACRVCHGLDYRSRHVLHPAVLKAAKLRRKIGAAPGLLSRLPKRPAHWRRDYWARSLRDLAAAERVISDLLSATLRAAKRQSARLDDGR